MVNAARAHKARANAEEITGLSRVKHPTPERHEKIQ